MNLLLLMKNKEVNSKENSYFNSSEHNLKKLNATPEDKQLNIDSSLGKLQETLKHYNFNERNSKRQDPEVKYSYRLTQKSLVSLVKKRQDEI